MTRRTVDSDYEESVGRQTDSDSESENIEPPASILPLAPPFSSPPSLKHAWHNNAPRSLLATQRVGATVGRSRGGGGDHINAACIVDTAQATLPRGQFCFLSTSNRCAPAR